MKKTITFIIIFLLLINIVSAQENQITPDKPFLYQLDLLFEKIQLFFATNEIQKLNLRISFIDERISELETVAKNKPQFLENAKQELDRERDELINVSKFLPDNIRGQVEINLEKSLQRLESLQIEMPDNIGIQRAVEVHKENIERFKEKKDIIEMRIKGGITEIKAKVDDKIVKYKIQTAKENAMIDDLSRRIDISSERIKGIIEIED